jgi:hypothetical protein
LEDCTAGEQPDDNPQQKQWAGPMVVDSCGRHMFALALKVLFGQDIIGFRC